MNNFKNILLLGISSIIWGIINYAYHPIMLRYLDTHTFWEFASLVWIFNILWVITWGLSFFLLKEISKNSDDLIKVKSIFRYGNKLLFLVWMGVYIIFVLFTPFLKDFLKIDDIFPLVLVGSVIILSFIWIPLWPILQGLGKFKFQSALWIIWSIVKLVFWVIFVILWYQLYGAIAGFILSGIITFLITYSYIHHILSHAKSDERVIKELKTDFKKDYKDILHSFLLIVCLAFYMNLDIILAKNLFSWEMAWIYAGVSVLFKFLIFLWWTIETVYYPQIIRNKYIIFHFLRNSLGMILLLWLGSITFFYLFWSFILHLLKPGLEWYTSLLVLWIAYSTLYISLSFLGKLLIGYKRYFLNYILILWIIALYIWTKYFWSSNLYSFIYVFLWVWSILIIIMSLMIWKLIRNK